MSGMWCQRDWPRGLKCVTSQPYTLTVQYIHTCTHVVVNSCSGEKFMSLLVSSTSNTTIGYSEFLISITIGGEYLLCLHPLHSSALEIVLGSFTGPYG
jgi:hypothetical protein